MTPRDQQKHPRRRISWRHTAKLAYWLPGIAALLAFGATLAPGLLPADAGEYQLVVAQWGVAHPPGYPLYTMLAGLLARLPIFDANFAYATNWFSAIVGALSVTLLSYSAQRETCSVLAGWLAGFGLLASASFWMVSTQASIRPLSVFFTIAMLEAALAYRRAHRHGRNTSWALVRFGAAAGLGVTHHGSLLFVGAVMALFIALVDWRAWRRWGLAVVSAALIGAVPWLYFAFTPNAPSELATWDGFWHYVLARGFAGDLFAHAHPSAWGERSRVLLEIFRLQWHEWVLLGGFVALVIGLLRDRWLFLLLLTGIGVHTFVAVTYRAPQTAEYALSAYALLAFGIGVSIGQFVGTRNGTASVTARRAPTLAIYTTCIMLVVVGGLRSAGANLQTWGYYASIEEARMEAEHTLQQAGSHALILAQWHRFTPLLYLQQVEGQRPDVDIEYVFPRGERSPMENWTQRIDDAVEAGRDVVITQFYPEAYRFLPYALMGQRVMHELHTAPFANPIADFGTIRLLGTTSTTLDSRAGATLALDLTLQFDAPLQFGELTTFVHIGQLARPPFAQQDVAIHAPNVTEPNSTLSVPYDVQIPQTMPPGSYHLLFGAYTPEATLRTEEGIERVPSNQELVPNVLIRPATAPLPTQNPLWRSSSHMHLRGWDADVTPQRTRLHLHWELVQGGGRLEVLSGEQVLSAALVDHELGTPRGDNRYWTSTHDIPPHLAAQGLQVRLADSSISLPPITQGRYIPMGDVAVLVGASAQVNGDSAELDLTWLPLGASYKEIHTIIGVQGENGRETVTELPVSGSIPASKWVYGRPVRTHHVLGLAQVGALQYVTVQLADSFTWRTEAIWNTLHNPDGLGVRVYP